MKRKIIIFLTIIGIIFVGCIFSKDNILIFFEKFKQEEIQWVEAKQDLQVMDVIKEEPVNKLYEIIESIDNIAGEYKDNMALYYYNFDSQDEYFFNEDTYFVTASLKKIPQIMQVLDKIQEGEISLDTKIEYIPYYDYANGTGILQFEETIGVRTIEELVKLAIIESDNIAYNMLNRLCNDSLLEYIGYIVGDDNIPNEEYTKLTVKQNFKILHKLYINPDNNLYYNNVIELMKTTAFNDRLDKYIPYNKVAHKIGSYFRYYHDEGIIFGNETYLLIILTKDIGELSNDPQFTEDEEERIVIDWGEEASEIIAKISKSIYDIIQR